MWVLPPAGEPRLLARTAGGLSGPVVARHAGGAVLARRQPASPGHRARSRARGRGRRRRDAERRKARKDRKVNAILHTGFPIRHWDHELGAESPRLFLVEPGGQPRDLVPDAGVALTEADYSISADAVTVAASWRTRGPGGAFPRGVVLVDVASGERTVLADEPDRERSTPADRPGRLPGRAAVDHQGLVRHAGGVRAADRPGQGRRAAGHRPDRRPLARRVGLVGRLADPLRRRRPARARRGAGRRPGHRHGPPPPRRRRVVLLAVPVAGRPLGLRAALGGRRPAGPGPARHRRRRPAAGAAAHAGAGAGAARPADRGGHRGRRRDACAAGSACRRRATARPR